jgi:uncharacterized flavoprotein (TIGR03862 family)
MSPIDPQPFIAIIGGGPAGLMAAETLAHAGAQVHVYEAMPTPGRKFLRAGVGGLNLTHSEHLEAFLSRYSQRERLEPILRAFGPGEVRQWATDLGFETFVGTSGRVFPVGMKASPMLRAWLQRLENSGVTFHYGYHWTDIRHEDNQPVLGFDTAEGIQTIRPAAVILALGGGSWPRLGSTGSWVQVLEKSGIPIAPLRPSNCGFDVQWSEHFKGKFDGAPLKPVTLSFNGSTRQGEFIVTKDGVEGSLIYSFSAAIRDEIELSGEAVITLDLSPDWSVSKLAARLATPRGSRTMSHHLEKMVGMKGVKAGLLWEFVPREDFFAPEKLAAHIKALPVPLVAPRPLAEAISSAGGVKFEALDEHLMLAALPGIFCAGEMMDWEAPTGGYLLTACLSTGRWAAQGALAWLGK